MKCKTKLSEPELVEIFAVIPYTTNQPKVASCEIFWESTWLNIRFLLPLAALLGAIADLNRRSFQSSGNKNWYVHIRSTVTPIRVVF